MDAVMEKTDTGCRTAVPPIGKMLVVAKFILPQDLEFALEHQKYCKKLLGEILVSMGALSPCDLERILSLQRVFISR